MTDSELRDKFKYKSFKLSSNNTLLKFELDQVIEGGKVLCKYSVAVDNGQYKMAFEPITFGPFLNIEVRLKNGESFLLNPDVSRLNNSQTITLTEEKVKWVCKRCEGSGSIQSEDGAALIDCPQCQGSGKYHPVFG